MFKRDEMETHLEVQLLFIQFKALCIELYYQIRLILNNMKTN
jgi:hypothetical protein